MTFVVTVDNGNRIGRILVSLMLWIWIFFLFFLVLFSALQFYLMNGGITILYHS